MPPALCCFVGYFRNSFEIQHVHLGCFVLREGVLRLLSFCTAL
jgi:hypothetical protein